MTEPNDFLLDARTRFVRLTAEIEAYEVLYGYSSEELMRRKQEGDALTEDELAWWLLLRLRDAVGQ